MYADATLVFPLVVAGTFAKAHWAEKRAAAAGEAKANGDVSGAKEEEVKQE